MGAKWSQLQGWTQVSLIALAGRQSQRIQNASDDKGSAPEAQETSGVGPQGVHPPLPLLKSKILLAQIKSNNMKLNRFDRL
jgi:hypothetical protein